MSGGGGDLLFYRGYRVAGLTDKETFAQRPEAVRSKICEYPRRVFRGEGRAIPKALQ